MTRDEVTAFFSPCGAISYVRITGEENAPSRFAFVEFAEEISVVAALALNGKTLIDRPIKIGRSKNAIVKPPQLQAKPKGKEVSDIQRKLDEAQARILSDILGQDGKKEGDAGERSRSRSRSPRHSSARGGSSRRSREGGERHERRRSRSRSPRRGRRDSDRDRERDRERERDKDRDRDGEHRHRHRSSREHSRSGRRSSSPR